MNTTTQVNRIRRLMSKLIKDINDLNLEKEDFKHFKKLNEEYQKLQNTFKQICFEEEDLTKIASFENKWVAQSIQFMVDIIPDIHSILLKYYRRINELNLIDIGAGSGAGSNLIAQLHADHMIYSKINVEAIDHVSRRLKWAKSQYPRINYYQQSLSNLQSNNWDLVVCSHCLEHVKTPHPFVEELIRICKGFLFIYTPYNEVDRIPGHLNTITEVFYEKYDIAHIRIFNSMAWHPDKEEDKVILACLDCRK